MRRTTVAFTVLVLAMLAGVGLSLAVAPMAQAGSRPPIQLCSLEPLPFYWWSYDTGPLCSDPGDPFYVYECEGWQGDVPCLCTWVGCWHECNPPC